ncbi:Leucine rich repeat [Popillia japonica]|uniref:Leucine rich repeat n=1 Tax=Popillia japonica TaxID=7064 RepID=A0AAW1IZI1_POPJA
MFRRNKKENKAKLEHKLYLARETPEPVFDLSDCGITTVPSGIYSLCRVFLKDCLKLDNNNLSSFAGGGNLQDLHLLKILDIHANEFTSLPNEIDSLINLRVLLISKNHLKKLPSSLCNLRHLEILDVSDNKLQSLPENLGNLICLRELNLASNKQLRELPKSICKAHNLSKITLDCEKFVYPPSEVVEKGAEAILQFVAKDTGYVYDETDKISSETESLNLDDLNFQAKIWKLEKIKEQKMREFLEIEKQNELIQQKELEIANASRVDRQKLLDDITKQQSKLDSDLAKIQEEKDVERFKFIEQLQIVEHNADLAINKLLAENNKEPLTQLLEMEREEEERIINAANESSNQLRKDDILNAMQEMIEQESKSFGELLQIRSETTQHILETELQSNNHLAHLIENHNLRQSELVAKIQEDSDLQKAAVCALLERGDARSWGLIQQVRLVEAQLAALTTIEMDRKRLKIDEQINDLSEKRANLSSLLMALLDQQYMRRIQLLSTIKILEEKGDTGEDFWLFQYQLLMDRMPSGIVDCQRNMNPSLVEALLMAGVWHCIPFLLKWSNNESELLNITEKDLRDAGLTDTKDCENVLQAFRTYSKQKYAQIAVSSRGVSDASPSAPVEELEEASAPPMESTGFATNECVICLDVHCQMIFVPCGHFCCCIVCASPVNNCPLCRSDIAHKIRVVPA